jgi:hypothetical protein
MGVDLTAAVPGGREQVMSGTSMATPNVWGEISLHARVRGITAVGEALDQVAKAVVESSVDTGRPSYEQGKGFRDVYAAHKALEGAGFAAARTVVPRGLRRLSIRGAKALSGLDDAKLKRIALTVGIGALIALAAYFLLTHHAAAAIGTMIPAVGGSLTESPRLPAAQALYKDALQTAATAAQTDSASLLFVRATGSSNPSTMQWNYEFRAGDKTVLVRFQRSPVGEFDRQASLYPTVQPDTAQAVAADLALIHSSEMTPDAALGAVQRRVPGYSADSFSYEMIDGHPHYVLFSADGTRAAVAVETGELAEPAVYAAAPSVDEVQAFRHILFSMRLRAEGELKTGREPKEAAQAIAARAEDLAAFYEQAAQTQPAALQAAADIRSVLGRLSASAGALAASSTDADSFRDSIRGVMDKLQTAAGRASSREELLGKFDEILGPAASSNVPANSNPSPTALGKAARIAGLFALMAAVMAASMVVAGNLNILAIAALGPLGLAVIGGANILAARALRAAELRAAPRKTLRAAATAAVSMSAFVNVSLITGLLAGPSPLGYVAGLVAAIATNRYASARSSGPKDGGNPPSAQPPSKLKKVASIAALVAAVPLVAMFTVELAARANFVAIAVLGILGPLLLGGANLLAAGALRKRTLAAGKNGPVRGLASLAVGLSSAINVLLLSVALSHSAPIALALGAAAGTATGVYAAGMSVPNITSKPLTPEAKKKLVKAGEIAAIVAILALAVFLVWMLAFSATEYLQLMNQQMGDPTNWDPSGF